LCLIWSTWRERDAICFEDCEKTWEELKNNLVKSLFSWTVAHISLGFLIFLNLWIFVFLLALKGDVLCIHILCTKIVPLFSF
jgi:hypothetical protein